MIRREWRDTSLFPCSFPDFSLFLSLSLFLLYFLYFPSFLLHLFFLSLFFPLPFFSFFFVLISFNFFKKIYLMIATINDILECEWCASLLQKFNLHKPTNHYWICWLMMWLTRPKCKTIFFGRWILLPDNPYCWCLLGPKFNRNLVKGWVLQKYKFTGGNQCRHH